ncbi:hypothetical protein U8Y98_01610 [Priestia megaterium]|uniref:hypothetical protein n=1 Tax=Priestia megaterium TaxID=1404 RepID=UPI002FE28134
MTLRDIIPELTNSNDFEVHSTRGRKWTLHELEELSRCKIHAETLLRNDELNDVFVIAKVCKLSLMAVRDLEAKYRKETKQKN